MLSREKVMPADRRSLHSPAKDPEFVVMTLTFLRFVFLRKALNKFRVHAVLKLQVQAGCDAPQTLELQASFERAMREVAAGVIFGGDGPDANGTSVATKIDGMFSSGSPLLSQRGSTWQSTRRIAHAPFGWSVLSTVPIAI